MSLTVVTICIAEPIEFGFQLTPGQNALGEYTNIVINSYLPSQTVRKRLTPRLGTTAIYHVV